MKTDLLSHGPLLLCCEPFDNSGPPGFNTGGYSGTRGERLVLKREINGEIIEVEVARGSPFVVRKLASDLQKILLFTTMWNYNPTPKAEVQYIREEKPKC